MQNVAAQPELCGRGAALQAPDLCRAGIWVGGIGADVAGTWVVLRLASVVCSAGVEGLCDSASLA